MYTSQQFKTILSLLPDFSNSELKVIQQTINAIIANKNQTNFNYIYPTWVENVEHISKMSASGYGTVIPQENLYSHPVTLHNWSVMRETVKDVSLSQVEPLNQKSAKDEKLTRPLGIWKGKVRMSEDFDDLSKDILAEFGME
ncbi:hypothetical protein [Nodularia chucula]|uniref:hypothetical protein n=1 Tax=Nodularia chucula TaxID=3093667 RepID=UPI0039C620D8